MGVIGKRKIIWQGKDIGEITIINDMPDYSNDPFFKKKKEDTIEFIKKHPIPQDFRSSDKKRRK
jgi:hypothetical protein